MATKIHVTERVVCGGLCATGYRKGIRSDVQHGNVIASIRQYEALCHDAWFYNILSAAKPRVTDVTQM